MTRSFRPALLAAGLATFFLAGNVTAEPPRMLGDFATGPGEFSQQPEGFQDVGGITVYTASDPAGFRQALWGSDGTAAGTRVLRILLPGGDFQAAGTAKGRAYYSSFVSTEGGNLFSSLWTTDGTGEGTTLLTPQPIPGWGPAAAGGYGLFFTACERNGACSFWSSDGTVEGTARRGASPPFGLPDSREVEPLQLVALERVGLQLLRRGERVDLLAIDPAGGVQVLRRFPTSGYSDRPRLLTAASGRAFFLAPVGGQLQLWTTDGTRGGTRALTGFTGSRGFSTTNFLRLIGDSVYFLADNGRHGIELWAHDGGRGGGRRLTDFTPAEPFEYLELTDGDPGSMLGRIGDVIVFSANGGDGWRLWTTRGTPASTQPLRGCPAGCPETTEGYFSSTFFARAGRRLVFAASDPKHGRELWTTDGTGPGTYLVSDLTPGPESLRLRIFTPAGRLVVFQNFTDEYDTENAELWVTDGTAAGTHRLAHGGPGDSHYFEPPHPRLDVGAPRSRVVVDGFEHDGREGLWASDGTAAGTGQIRAGRFPAGSATDGADFVWFGDRLLARLTRGSDRELLVLDAGGAGGLEPLVQWPDGSPVLVGDRAVVAAYPDAGVYEIWGTDGTPAGTQQLLNDPRLAPVDASPSPRWGALFLAFPKDDNGGFNLGDPVTLYRTDGTPAGTLPLLELPRGMIPYSPVEIGGRIYLHAYEYGREGFRVWTSDGTVGGTVPLFAGSTDGYHPPYFTEFGGEVVFLALGADGTVGLWRTAGTLESTRRIARLADYELWNRSQGWSFEVAAGKIYFWAPASPDVTGPLHPWVSDGTAAGTRQLAGVVRDVPSYIYIPWRSREFVAVGTRVFFAADDGVHGGELWSTDGTPGGTALAADLWPGPFGSDPRQLTALGDDLAFTAQTFDVGAELRLFTPCTGTIQTVADLAPGPSWSVPLDLLWDPSRAVLLFSAHDGVHGYEPWEWRPGNALGACSAGTSEP